MSLSEFLVLAFTAWKVRNCPIKVSVCRYPSNMPKDFFAHSNYIELALTEIGERDIFPHCGRDTQIELEGARGPVYPIVT